ncbi:SusC/RagA family TonB-linked outer membrane protein [Puia dinghuensis]|uniref:SusC/RagA family TonB-linked outer membrane protein n=1 Tax=Puia dinghuensis TaxID=1792502 RepID=A0A8J2XQS1_9BACT|nr:SusC/RagA family TonB-linked outer membrane protein [Puia dinghuensis]GGA83918.1 SusC/RagA family TonB-linked outer membrane protein [Puia dinghuensis]
MKKTGRGLSPDRVRVFTKYLLMTKLAILCIFALSIQSFARGYGQGNINLRLEKTQLKKVFKAIEDQGFFRFVYKDEILPKDQRISIVAKGASVEQVLDKVLERTGLSYHRLTDNLIVIIRTGNGAPEKPLAAVKVSGRVTNEKDEPLKDVSVVEKGTNNGTMTKEDGTYTLEVTSPNATLLFSFVGYAPQEYAIKGKLSVDVRLLAGDNPLKDVVVVGYASQKKVTVTGAVATVKGTELEKTPTVNLSNSLVGRLPGVYAVQASGEPGYDGSTIRIRGTNTLGNTSALIVVDGVPDIAGGLERLNPADIESMSVLKDASAAIYGARAANGVILVTTKHGKSGKPQLSYTFNHGWAQPDRIPKMANAVEYAAINNETTIYDHVPAAEWSAAEAAFNQAGKYTTLGGSTVTAPFQPGDVQKYGNGSDPWGHPNTDWFKTTLKTWSPQVQHTLQLNGGNDAIRYLASVGYEDQDGYYKNSATGYKQYDMRINVDARVNKWIMTGINLTGREEFRFYPTQSAGSIFRMLMRGRPTDPEVWPNGLPGPDIENGQNPIVITTNQTGYDKDKRDYFQANGKVEVSIPWVPGLKITGTGTIDKENRVEKGWQTPWYLYFWDHVTYQADGKTPVLTKSLRSTFTTPQLAETYYNYLNVLLSGFINYDKTIGDHTINLMAAVTRETDNEDDFNAYRTNFISSAVDQLFAGGANGQVVGGSAYERARLSYFGRAAYNYKEKYLAEFLWRYDGSYLFPAAHRFGFFPGVLAGWRISEENFWKGMAHTVPYLKLRGSWGQLGNDQVYYGGVLKEYQYLGTYGFGSYTINGQAATTLHETVVPNPNFTWEVANNSDVGLEGQLLDGMFNFEFDYFYNKRNHILWQPQGSTPASSGIASILPPENIGRTENKGYEFTVGYNGHAGGFTYSVSVNGGYAKNKILFYDEAPGAPAWQRATGHPFSANGGAAFLVYQYDGVFKDAKDIAANTIDYSGVTPSLRPGDMKFKDINHQGKIDGNSQVRLNSTPDPTFTGGLNIRVGYKNFDLSVLFQGATGGFLFFGTESGDIGNYLQYSYDHQWTIDHPSSTDPRLANRGNTYYTGGGAWNNTYFLRSSDYLRLKNVEVGYNFSPALLKRASISNLRIYANGLNLITWDKMKIYDPESTSGSGQYYPQSRIINAGVRATF